MGIEASYQALPVDSVLLERARTDAEWGRELGLLSAVLAGGVPGAKTQVELAFELEVASLRTRRPGIELRVIDIDHDWDTLHYLLSDNRRNHVFDADDVGTVAIRGQNDVGEGAKALQGSRIRYTSPHVVERVARHLASFTRETLFAHFDAHALEAAGVYKHQADPVDATELHWTWKRFEDLRRFYVEVAQHGEGALVIVD